jgi:hypothetical protein
MRIRREMRKAPRIRSFANLQPPRAGHIGSARLAPIGARSSRRRPAEDRLPSAQLRIHGPITIHQHLAGSVQRWKDRNVPGPWRV